MRKSGRQERESVFIRHAVATVPVFILASLAAGSSIGQAPNATSAAASAKISRGPDESVETSYDAEKGRALYVTHCSGCHGADGQGHAGMYPPIKGSGVVTKDDAKKHIQVVLNGLHGEKAGGVLYSIPMPPFGGILKDAELTDIIDYERSSWGNHGKLVTTAQVAAQRGHSK
jgi:mono/diheme cytochrome c family protein